MKTATPAFRIDPREHGRASGNFPLVALLGLAAIAGRSDSSYSTGPAELPPLPQFDGRLTFVDTTTVDRMDRTALVVLPSSYDHETRIPILFGYHGGGGSAAQMQTQT